MSRSFTKLFASITESTVWCESLATRVCWIAMLAMADRHGRVWASVPGLANRARISIEETKTALDCFLAPDPYSRTPDYEGRRIEVIDGGWRLLNYAKYRALRDEEERREYQREWDRQHRSGRTRNPTNPTNSDRHRPRPTQAEAEAEAEKRPTAGRRGDPATPEGFEAFLAAYPTRCGDNPRARAIRAYSARLRDGHTPEEILAGAQRYARFVRANGWEGSQYVKAAATFLGRDKPFLEAWALMNGKGHWRASGEAMMAKAKELGISTRGETTESLARLIEQRIAGVAA